MAATPKQTRLLADMPVPRRRRRQSLRAPSESCRSTADMIRSAAHPIRSNPVAAHPTRSNPVRAVAFTEDYPGRPTVNRSGMGEPIERLF